MYITCVQLETFSTISDIITYILNWFFHFTIGCSIILNIYCNYMVCHPRCVFKLYGEMNSVKNTTINYG